MDQPTITAGRMTVTQHEDGSLHAAYRHKAGPSGRVVASIAVPAAHLERWLLRQMRAELLPMQVAPSADAADSAPGALGAIAERA